MQVIDNIQLQGHGNKPIVEMQLTAKPYHRHTTPIKCKIDTGAEMNVMFKQDFENVVAQPLEKQLSPPQCKITAYGGHRVKSLGSCQLYLHHSGDGKAVPFEVTEGHRPSNARMQNLQ